MFFHRIFSPCDCFFRCGNNYGWSRLEGNRCQDTNEDIFGACLGADRSGFTPPIFEYCHADYVNVVEDDADLVDGVDICGGGLVTGSAVVGMVWFLCLAWFVSCCLQMGSWPLYAGAPCVALFECRRTGVNVLSVAGKGVVGTCLGYKLPRLQELPSTLTPTAVLLCCFPQGAPCTVGRYSMICWEEPISSPIGNSRE